MSTGEEMKPFDDEFLARLRQTFQLEASEHLETMTRALLELEEKPTPACVEELYRALHSLKGAARAVNMEDVEAICQRLEWVVAAWRKEGRFPTEQELDLWHPVISGLQKMVEGSLEQEARQAITALVDQLEDMETPSRTPLRTDPQMAPPPAKEIQMPDDVKSVQTATLKTEDPELFQEIWQSFCRDGMDQLALLGQKLVQLEEEPTAAGVQAVLKILHSLKGACAAVDLDLPVQVLQHLEQLLQQMLEKDTFPDESVLDLLHRGVNLLQQVVEAPPEEALNEERTTEAQALLAECRHCLSRWQKPDARQKAPSPAGPADRGKKPKPPPLKSPPLVAMPTPGKTASIRVDGEKLDRLLFRAEELVAGKLALSTRIQEMQRFLNDLHRLVFSTGQTSQAGNNGMAQTNPTEAQGVRELEKQMKSLLNRLQQDERLLGAMIDSLLEEAKKFVMLPVSSLTQSFPKMVRDLSRALGKKARLVIQGQEVEIDKRILEEIKDPLIHLIRNALDHGLEHPDERRRLGKPERGELRLSFRPSEGGKVEVALQDDGAGINLAKVRQRAIQQGLVSPEEAERLNEQEIMRFIFHSQFSTSDMITDISGRGLGMAIVQEKVDRLGGYLAIESKPGKGTCIRMVFPLSLARYRGVLIRAQTQRYVVPTTSLLHVVRVPTSSIRSIKGRATVLVDGEVLPVAHLAQVLSLPLSSDSQSPAYPALVVNRGSEKMVLLVDEVIGEQEMVVKGLGPLLQRVKNFSGATITGDGHVVPILNVHDLFDSAQRVGRLTPSLTGQTEAARPPVRILLAEDSITSRTLLAQILTGAGYQVTTAVDGEEAWSLLQQSEFDLVVSDVEMPRMDGFELTRNIRTDPRLQDLPVVLVTSLGSQEDQRRGAEVGADAYIIKSNFEEGTLLDTIKWLVLV